MLEDVHKELSDDSRLMETQMKELSMKLDNLTSSLVTGITNAANPNCILLASVSLLTDITSPLPQYMSSEL